MPTTENSAKTLSCWINWRTFCTVRDGSYAGNNYGTAGDLQVAYNSTPGSGSTRDAFFTFDLTSVTQIDKAVFSLYGPETFLRGAVGLYSLKDELGRETARGTVRSRVEEP